MTRENGGRPEQESVERQRVDGSDETHGEGSAGGKKGTTFYRLFCMKTSA